MTSELKVDKITPASGTSTQIGESGDTITIPSGCTITNNGTATNFGASTLGALTDVIIDKASVGTGGGNFYNGILIDPSTDGAAPNLDTVTGNANNNYGIGKDTFSALTSGIANVAIG